MIKYAILGILNWKPATGYEIKKMFEESSILYWSGNNNQIYTTLIQMQKEELVTSEVINQTSLPAKKIYTITEEGINELKEWLISDTEITEFKKSILIKLAWSNLLNDQELNNLLLKYENDLNIKLLMQKEKNRRFTHLSSSNNRDKLINEMILENLIQSYKNEISWVQETRKKLLKTLSKRRKKK